MTSTIVVYQSLAAQFDGKKDLHLRDIMAYLIIFSFAERVIFSEVVILLKIILITPATNGISERSFSAMRRFKTYLRSTMEQKRLNAVMLLHIHREKTKQLSVVELANMFASTDFRMSVFGTLKKIFFCKRSNLAIENLTYTFRVHACKESGRKISMVYL